MLDRFKNSRTDRRDEIALVLIALLIPVVALYAMIGL